MFSMKKLLLLIVLFFLSNSLFAQEEKYYTNYFENGHYWLAHKNHASHRASQYSFLNSKLFYYEAKRISERKDYLIDCREELKKLQEQGKSDSIGLETVTFAISDFFSNKENLNIPIIDAYCYCIKEFSGTSKEGLIRYRLKLLEKTGN